MVHAKKLAWCVLVVSLACSSAPTAGEDACRDGEKIRSYLLETADYIEVCVEGKRIIKGFVERVREIQARMSGRSKPTEIRERGQPYGQDLPKREAI